MRLATGNLIYRRVFDFWLKVFALSFRMGVVTGIVMAFQFATNWSGLSERTGPIQGPLLGYEVFTAFMLEATFFGMMLLGRDRVPPWFYLFSCCMFPQARCCRRSGSSATTAGSLAGSPNLLVLACSATPWENRSVPNRVSTVSEDGTKCRLEAGDSCFADISSSRFTNDP